MPIPTQSARRRFSLPLDARADRLSHLYRGEKNDTTWGWSKDWQLKRAIMYAHAGDWEKCREIGAANSTPKDDNTYRICLMLAVWCLGAEVPMRFLPASERFGSEWFVQRSVRLLFMRVAPPIRERLLAEVPPFILIELFMYGFMHSEEVLDLRRDSLAVLRANAGNLGPIGLLRSLADRALADARKGEPFVYWDTLDKIERFFTHPLGWDGLTPNEKDTDSARALLSASALLAASLWGQSCAKDLLERLEALGGDVDKVKSDPLYSKADA